jgi:subtilisin family serine protease
LLSGSAHALKTETIGGTATAGVRKVRTVASGRALIRLSSGTDPASLDAPLAALSAHRVKDLGSNWLLVVWNDGAPVSAKLPSLAALTGVAAAQPSSTFKAFTTPNDPLFNSQYALAAVEAPAGWEYEVGNSSTVTIALIDSGIDSTQPDLSTKFAHTTSYSYDSGCSGTPCPATLDQPPTPACSHATQVAGVASASTDNGVLVSGVSWGAQLVSYKVFDASQCQLNDCDALTTCVTDDDAMISAINQAVSVQNTAAYGHIVINMSLGAPGDICSTDDVALAATVSNAISHGIVIVAAAGNSGGTSQPGINSPGNCPGVIPMGATDNTNSIAYFSSQGSQLATSGLVAPGVGVLTTDINGGTAGVSGTSFASPMGAGLAALLLSANPTWTPAQVQAAMRGGAQDLGQSGNAQGAGLMNVFRSLKLAKTGTLAGFAGDQKPIAFPNPFRLSQTPNVTFSFPASIQGSNLDIKIYTLQGGFVRELSEPLWDGKNANGNLVASGTYVFVVKTDKGSSTARMAVIR